MRANPIAPPAPRSAILKRAGSDPSRQEPQPCAAGAVLPRPVRAPFSIHRGRHGARSIQHRLVPSVMPRMQHGPMSSARPLAGSGSVDRFVSAPPESSPRCWPARVGGHSCRWVAAAALPGSRISVETTAESLPGPVPTDSGLSCASGEGRAQRRLWSGFPGASSDHGPPGMPPAVCGRPFPGAGPGPSRPAEVHLGKSGPAPDPFLHCPFAFRRSKTARSRSPSSGRFRRK